MLIASTPYGEILQINIRNDLDRLVSALEDRGYAKYDYEVHSVKSEIINHYRGD